MSQFCLRVEDTIAHIREFLARNRKLISPYTLVGRIATPGSWKSLRLRKSSYWVY